MEEWKIGEKEEKIKNGEKIKKIVQEYFYKQLKVFKNKESE